MTAPVGLSFLLVGDPRCTTFIGAAVMPIANGDLAHPRITAEDLQLQRQSGQSTVVPSASVPKCCRALPSAAKLVAAASRGQKRERSAAK